MLTFQLANEFHPKRVIRNYIPEDSSSRSHAVGVLEWNNIFYQSRKKIVWGRKSNVRIGVAQWKMRAFKSFEELLQQVEFFVDTVSGYKADLLLLSGTLQCPPPCPVRPGGSAHGHALP